MIVVAGQRPGADRHALVRRVGGAVEMIDSEPQCQLSGGVAFDLDVAELPAACPGRLVFRQDPAPAQVSRSAKFVTRLPARFQIVGATQRHGNSALETHNLPRASSPTPGPCQSVGGDRRKIVAVDLQRRCSSHGEALAGTLSPPHAEILIDPFGDESEIRLPQRTLPI